jgi:hypothetical protein
MLSSAFDLGEEINNRTVDYKLHSALWDRFTFTHLNIQFEKWKQMKYLNEACDDFNPDINTIPNNTGGLYLFFVKCNLISGITEYPFYIGRAKITENQDLRKRVKEYFEKYSKNNERPKITRMFKYWANDLYVAYFPLEDNEDIIELEAQLINSLLLPMNDVIPNQEIKQAVKAFLP